jgi:hypothetical protein
MQPICREDREFSHPTPSLPRLARGRSRRRVRQEKKTKGTATGLMLGVRGDASFGQHAKLHQQRC